MYSRLATIWPRKNYASDTTEIIDININDPISQIIVTYEPDNNPSGAHATAHPAKCVEKIEIVDGSEVLYSLSGQEAQAVDFYNNNAQPLNVMCYLNGMTSEMIFTINFGRYLFDEIYALDPRKFRNLQLKITLDIDAGGDESNDGYLTVLAQIFDSKNISPIGFLMHKRIKQYTLADSAHEYTDLPTDYPYKGLFLMAQRYGTGPEYQIDNVKLTEDNDRKIPLNHSMFQVLRNIASQWKAWEEWILVHSSTTVQYFYNTPGYWPNFAYVPWRSASLALAGVCYGGDGGRFQYDAGSDGPNASIICLGWAPHSVVPLLPRFRDDPETWYDVSQLGSLRLDVTAASSVGTAQTAEIIAQQLKNY